VYRIPITVLDFHGDLWTVKMRERMCFTFSLA